MRVLVSWLGAELIVAFRCTLVRAVLTTGELLVFPLGLRHLIELVLHDGEGRLFISLVKQFQLLLRLS